MRFYLKQRVFSWSDKFTVYDENGTDCYYVQGEVLSFGKRLHLCDLSGRELLYIRQKMIAFLPQYRIFQNGVNVAEMIKEFTLFHPAYRVEPLGWRVRGDFFDHDYEILCGNQTVAAVSKQWFTFGDAYEINVSKLVDPVMALAVALVIDACIEASQNN